MSPSAEAGGRYQRTNKNIQKCRRQGWRGFGALALDDGISGAVFVAASLAGPLWTSPDYMQKPCQLTLPRFRTSAGVLRTTTPNSPATAHKFVCIAQQLCNAKRRANAFRAAALAHLCGERRRHHRSIKQNSAFAPRSL
jgi:hypothetical protein